MKVFFCLLFTLCTLFFPSLPSPKTASADGERFACVTTERCYFYSLPDAQNGVFILPQSYYVKILDEEELFYRIQYLTDGESTKAIVGYVEKATVSPVDYTPKTPYLYKSFDVTYQTGGGVGEGFLTQITLSCTYYGDYCVGTAAYCYVLRGEEFGYVPKPTDFSYEKNHEYEANLPTVSVTETDDPSSPPYLLFILLALLFPVAAFFIFRFSSKKPYEEPDER